MTAGLPLPALNNHPDIQRLISSNQPAEFICNQFGYEGFNLARDDQDFVAAHQGVVTRDDGLATSVLDESHRFLGPVAKSVVTRTQ